MSIRTSRNSKRAKAAACGAALAASLFAVAAPAVAQTGSQVTVTRSEGADRFATAAKVALESFAGTVVDDIVLVSGENFPDGLAAASIAGAANAPVLLTRQGSLPSATIQALLQLRNAGATDIHIVGGPQAISTDVRAELQALGFAPTDQNIIAGDNRYATAASISQFLRQAAPTGLGATIGTFQGLKTAIIATGENFPDALAAGALAAEGPYPILLTRGGDLPAETRAELNAAGIEQAIILGGSTAVSDNVRNEIENLDIVTRRVSGATRQDTAANLARLLITTPEAQGGGFSANGIVLVSGNSFADALVAGPLAARLDQAILLTGGQGTMDFLSSPVIQLQNIRVVGGSAAVSDPEVNNAVAASLTGPRVTAATSDSVGTRAFLNTTPADLNTNVNIVSDEIGPEPIEVAFTAGTGNNAETRVSMAQLGDARRITVVLGTNSQGMVDATPAEVAAAINNNAAAAAVITATPTNPVSLTGVPPMPLTSLTGGTRVANIQITFDEALGEVVVGGMFVGEVGLDYNADGFIDRRAQAAEVQSDASDLAAGRLQLRFELANREVIQLGTTQVRISGIPDIAGNPNLPTARVLTDTRVQS